MTRACRADLFGDPCGAPMPCWLHAPYPLDPTPPAGDPERQAWLERHWEQEERLVTRYRQRETMAQASRRLNAAFNELISTTLNPVLRALARLHKRGR